MFPEPPTKRVFAFVDGQNLFGGAKEAFGYSYPNYDVSLLSRAVCATQPGWNLEGVKFYTGIPTPADDAYWNHFWTAKLAQMGRQKVEVFSRAIRYRDAVVALPVGGVNQVVRVGKEKGIDVRIALDIVRLAQRKAYDVALLFSQDQDLSEVAREIKVMSKEQIRWMEMASAYPVSPMAQNHRGIDGTRWIGMDRAFYDPCIDTRDYRPKRIVS